MSTVDKRRDARNFNGLAAGVRGFLMGSLSAPHPILSPPRGKGGAGLRRRRPGEPGCADFPSGGLDLTGDAL